MIADKDMGAEVGVRARVTLPKKKDSNSLYLFSMAHNTVPQTEGALAGFTASEYQNTAITVSVG